MMMTGKVFYEHSLDFPQSVNYLICVLNKRNYWSTRTQFRDHAEERSVGGSVRNAFCYLRKAV